MKGEWSGFHVLLLLLCVIGLVPGAGLLYGAEAVTVPLEGSWAAPLPSPDGRYLAFTTPAFSGLYLLDLQSGQVTQLTDLQGAGFRPAWSPDSRSLAFRGTVGRKHLIVVAHPDGVKEVASPLLDSISLPFWRGLELCYFVIQEDTPVLRRVGPSTQSEPLPAVNPSGRLSIWHPEGKAAQVAAESGKTFFLPVLSEDGNLFVVQCLDGHLYLGSTEGGPLKDLGPGSSASFVRRDTAILFERSADDGHIITECDLHLLDLATLDVTAVTATKDRIERHPAMTGDGHTIYFDADGIIYQGWVP